ncbi:MAG: CpsB/CapC family capsule biosynthesis tyrosine phosphatase [Lachnospiraceae bacterium]
MHDHSIYGVDDGAKSPEESLEMLKLAYEDGIRRIILTPHAHYKRGRATPEEIREKVTLLQEQIKEACPELCLYSGSDMILPGSQPPNPSELLS